MDHVKACAKVQDFIQRVPRPGVTGRDGCITILDLNEGYVKVTDTQLVLGRATPAFPTCRTTSVQWVVAVEPASLHGYKTQTQ